MATDKRGREIKVGDIYFVPSDCEGLQFFGVVTEVSDGYVSGLRITHSKYTTDLSTSAMYEPEWIVVLSSIEDTRMEKKEEANVVQEQIR